MKMKEEMKMKNEVMMKMKEEMKMKMKEMKMSERRCVQKLQRLHQLDQKAAMHSCSTQLFQLIQKYLKMLFLRALETNTIRTWVCPDTRIWGFFFGLAGELMLMVIVKRPVNIYPSSEIFQSTRTRMLI